MLSIENTNIQAARFFSQGRHIGEFSPLVEGDDFTVDHRFVGHCMQGVNDGRILGIEIPIVARREADSTAALNRLRAEAIELQFVQPYSILRQLLCTLQEHGFDESGCDS